MRRTDPAQPAPGAAPRLFALFGRARRISVDIL